MGLADFIKRIKNSLLSFGESDTYEPIEQHMQILAQSMDILSNTTNPDTFFSREDLAIDKATLCMYDPRIIWKDMRSEDIYHMLTDDNKRDEWHKRFIDRMFEKGKEDNLIYQMEKVSSNVSPVILRYIEKRLKGRKYHFCKVTFDRGGRAYTYVSKDKDTKRGGIVSVPVGNGRETKLAYVEEVFDGSLGDLPFPLDKLRSVSSSFKNIDCPHCGARIGIDATKKTGRCEHCNTEFYLLHDIK